jgi:hypothetical protein
MRFDAYAGNMSMDHKLGHAAELAAHVLGGQVTKGRPRRRYRDVAEVTVGDRTAAWFGIDTGNELLYFEGKGETTPEFVDIMRTHFAGHTAIRLDVCEDFDAPGAFERLVTLARDVKPQRVKSGFERLPDDAKDGRTWTAGARSSPGYFRAYEKGKQPLYVPLNRPNWTRAEWEMKPHYAADKAAAATMSPEQAIGLVPWTAAIAQVVLGVDIPKYDQIHRQYTDSQTKIYLARTFRRFWMEQLEEGRDWACIGREFEDIWAMDDSLKQ